MKNFLLKPGALSRQDLHLFFSEKNITLSLDPACIDRILQSANVVSDVIAKGSVVYGINTGFGLLANTRIAEHELELLQRSIVLSHAAGTGEYLDDDVVRFILLLKINSLAQGYSGIRLETIDALIRLFNAKIYPCIPEKGSVGASGDLAPLAHLSCVLLGESVVRHHGKIISAEEGLRIAELTPLTLAPKEGLALLNGTQVSTALALTALFSAENLFYATVITGAMSVDALLGSVTPFDPRIHEVRRHQGQITAAKLYRDLLSGSEINQSHKNCSKVQDPYSLRCQPQVMGACLEQINNAMQTLTHEANSVTDNPLVFVETGEILSGGNFHAEPVAMVADNLALSIAEMGALSERRIALLTDPHMSQLPAFLVQNSGVNSGFMLAQVTAAAVASENKSLAHPASVDSLPTSANQEDHVSMATFAARRLRYMLDNTYAIAAIEWLAAAQGIDFRQPLRTSLLLQKAHALLRDAVSFYDKDRYFADDITKAIALIKSGALTEIVMPIDQCQ